MGVRNMKSTLRQKGFLKISNEAGGVAKNKEEKSVHFTLMKTGFFRSVI